MEQLAQNKNRLSLSKRMVATLGLAALATSLYAGDRAQYDGDMWVGDRHAMDIRFLSAGRSASLPPAGDFSVATYNIKNGQLDYNAVVHTARSLGATILGLTEAGSGLAHDIARADYHVVDGLAGNVLLSKLPVKDSFSVPLPHEPDHGARAALFAKIDLGTSDTWFVVTHLSNNEWPDSAQAMRLKQIDALQHAIDQRLDSPPIIVGDLNFEPSSTEYHLLDQHYDDGLSELGLTNMETFRGGFGMKRYDYMFIDQRLGYHAIAGGRDSSTASDHMPIIMVLAADDHRGSLPAVQ